MEKTEAYSRTKREQILAYIESLQPGTKISVRSISKELGVSEGTAYRAIKEAESRGDVATRERMGTIRIDRQNRQQIEHLTFAEVANIVDGEVLGGEEGLDKTLNKFVIGAMEEQAMMRYIDEGSLLIVGNRTRAHTIALEQQAGVLITGGFGTGDDVIRLADERRLPIISSAYDTFTVASMINRAMYDRMIKKKIVLVDDILTERSEVISLKAHQTVNDFQAALDATGHSRFPVVDEWNRALGIITSKDIIGAPGSQEIDKLMTRHPLTVTRETSVATAAHMMVWEGIELLPVIDQNRKLVGVISRQDVLKAMQYAQRQPQIRETFEELIWSSFDEEQQPDGSLLFRGAITPQMSSGIGTVSAGVWTTLITRAAFRAINTVKKGDLVLDNMSTYLIKPVQIDAEVTIRPQIIEVSRKFGKADVVIYQDGQPVCKALLTAQLIEQV